MARLERLTYVHDGNQGIIGALIAEARGQVRFGNEGSGLLELHEPASSSRPLDPRETSVRIVAMLRSQLPPDGAEAAQDDVPCILGHSGDKITVLVSGRSLSRVTGGMGDLRGKIKFGLARIGWDL